MTNALKAAAAARPTDAEIEAFLAAKKAKEAEEAKAKKAARQERTGRRTAADVKKEFPGREMHYCTITGGNKFEHGTTVECHWIGVNSWGQDVARIFDKSGNPIREGDKDKGWINPKFLKPGKELPAARIAAIEAQRDTSSDETILVPASVGLERDKAVLINYSGWFGGMFVPKTMIAKVGEMEDGRGIFEIPAWKVRKEKGADALAALQAKQAELTKLAGLAK